MAACTAPGAGHRGPGGAVRTALPESGASCCCLRGARFSLRLSLSPVPLIGLTRTLAVGCAPAWFNPRVPLAAVPPLGFDFDLDFDFDVDLLAGGV